MSKLAVSVTLGLVFLVGSVTAAEQVLRPSDFALGIPLQHDEGLPYFEIELPELAYRTATDPALRDIRIFDADGRVLRHFVAPTDNETERAFTARTALPIFPVTESASAVSIRESITVASNGRLVTIRSHSNQTSQQVHAYIVDASTVQDPVNHFQINTGGDEFGVTPYAVDGSTDLASWSLLLRRADMVRLQHSGRTLEQARFKLNLSGNKYLRIRWLQPATAPTIAEVLVHLRRSGHSEVLHSFAVAGHRVEDEPLQIDYDLGGYFPLREVAMRLTPNRFIAGTLSAARDIDGPWTTVQREDWYALKVDDLVMRSAGLDIHRDGFRYWRFTASDEHQLADAELPLLQFGWRAQRYRVLAEGQGPYLLAVGSGRAANRAVQTLPLAARDMAGADAMSAPAALGERVSLGGDERLRKPKPALPWQRIVLWCVLCVGVGGIGVVAWRLYREMNQAGR